jgi:hypothetical protein
MKKQQFKELIGMLAAATFILLMPACATQTGAVADTEMERALLSAGFKVRPATTAEQRSQLGRMPDDQFKTAKQNGETYYVYADKRDNRVYVGDRWAFQAYQGYLKNNNLRKQGAFVWEIQPGDKANNRTVEVWNGYPPFHDW